jgi:sucrose-6-phosphate hydrolase SacC (GH32 family)
MRYAIVWLAAAFVISLPRAGVAALYDEAYRPQFHFTAKQGWLNDPNGLVYFNGQYHLFYQHNPFGTSWGNMSWGHATSPDLLHWTEKSPAIVGDPTGVKFSGSAVIDEQNTSGLQSGGTPTMALFYTSVGSFDQRIAYSNDGGASFRYYEGNPVLPSVSQADDRDPRVFWHGASQKWVQALWVAAHDGKPAGVSFFGSPDLKNWSHLSDVPNYFETPDFFELPVDGNANNKRWVLYGGSGKYQVGTFDGATFTPDAPAAGMLTQDYGANFYAAQTWNNVPAADGRRLQVAWMAGASYPGMPFNQQMSVPVELSLRSTPNGVRMYRQPVAEIASLHGTGQTLSNVLLTPGVDPLGSLSGDLFHIKTQIELGAATTVGFNIRGAQVTYNVASQTLSALGRSAPLAPTNGKIDLELLVDRSSLEIFGGNGLVSMTSGFTPSPGSLAIDLFASGGNARVVSLSAFPLQSVWASPQPAAPSGLISRWRFEDPANSASFVDVGGRSFHLADSGVSSVMTGVAGAAADLDNPGDYAFMPDNSEMDADSFSVSLWVKPDNQGQAANLVGKAHYSRPGSWGLERTNDGRLKFFVESSEGQVAQVFSDQPVNVGAWNHAVASYDADLGRLELYVNGSLSGVSENEVHGGVNYDLAPLMVGRRTVGSNPLDAVDGKIDELQLYGSPLTPGEVGFLRLHPDLPIDPTTYAEGPLRLQLNADTGAAAIVNGGSFAESFKGYSILSNRAGLSVSGWNSLDDRTGPTYAGWEEANPTPSSLSELNVAGSYTVGASARVTLGTPASAFPAPKFGVGVRNTEFAFEYVAPDGQVLHGDVELVGSSAVNNLQLTVDPTSGQVVLGNKSTYTVALLGYSISSDSGSLRPANGQWSSLADQGLPGVDEANASTGSLSELIPFAGNALVLTPGQTLSLGAAFNVAGSHDLDLEFYLTTEPLPGDFNADGDVDSGDLVAWKAGYGVAYAGADLLVWQRNLGRSNPNAVPVIMRGVVAYQSIVASANVPEPSSHFHWASTIVFAVRVAERRRRGSSRGRLTSDRSNERPQFRSPARQVNSRANS